MIFGPKTKPHGKYGDFMIRLSKSSISDSEKKAVLAVLEEEFLGMGTEVQKFEDKLSEFFGRRTVCVNTGTAALQLALQAANIGEGDEVLVQSLTYVASFQAISATGATPIACEVNPITLTLDPIDVEKRITTKTKAIMPVHYSGGIGELDAIYNLARINNLRVIEDAAHAFNSSHKGNIIGSFGDISCFSFDGIKNITSGEGGCVVSSDENLLNRIKDIRLLGVEKDTEQRYRGERSWQFDVKEQGWRAHMSNIMAAIGLVQFDRRDELSHIRRILAKKYKELLDGWNVVSCIPHNYDEVVPHIFTIQIEKNWNRAKVQKELLEKGIQTGIHYQPNHWLSLYKQEGLPITETVYEKLLTLPLHADLNEKDVEFTVCELKRILD
jgi:dTDP-4-amino-4,6-dideoxygalactose transaminase